MPVFHPGVPGFKGLPVGSEAEKEALRRVLDLCAEEYAQRTGKTVLYVLSYWDFTCKKYLETGQRFDQELVDWFKGKGLPCVDLLECHRQEYEEDFKCYDLGQELGPVIGRFAEFQVK